MHFAQVGELWKRGFELFAQEVKLCAVDLGEQVPNKEVLVFDWQPESGLQTQAFNCILIVSMKAVEHKNVS